MASQEKKIPKIFLRVKPIKALISLNNGPKNLTQTSKDIDCTYSHTVKLLEQFKTWGIVDFEKKGRVKVTKLTDTGEDIAKSAENLLAKLLRLKERTA